MTHLSDQSRAVIRAARQRAKLTDMALAERIGMARGNFSAVMSGAKSISDDALASLCKLLGLEIVPLSIRRKRATKTAG